MYQIFFRLTLQERVTAYYEEDELGDGGKNWRRRGINAPLKREVTRWGLPGEREKKTT